MGIIQYLNDNIVRDLCIVSWVVSIYFFLRYEKESLKIWGIISKVIKSVLIALPVIVIIFVFNFLVLNRYPLTPELKAEITARKKEVKLNPGDRFARFDLLVTYGYSNRIRKAYGEYKELRKMNLDDSFGDAVVRKYRVMVKDDPADWKARFRLAFSLYSIGKKKEGIKQLEEIIERYPDNVWAYVYAGLAYAGIRDRVKGVELFEKAREINPRIAVVHLSLGNGYKKIGKNKDSSRAYLRGVWLAICGW